MKYSVYILQSKKDKGYYVGMTSDITKRLSYHNKGRVRSTKRRGPWQLVYFENHSTREDARSREKYLKSYKGSTEKAQIVRLHIGLIV